MEKVPHLPPRSGRMSRFQLLPSRVVKKLLPHEHRSDACAHHPLLNATDEERESPPPRWCVLFERLGSSDELIGLLVELWEFSAR